MRRKAYVALLMHVCMLHVHRSRTLAKQHRLGCEWRPPQGLFPALADQTRSNGGRAWHDAILVTIVSAGPREKYSSFRAQPESNAYIHQYITDTLHEQDADVMHHSVVGALWMLGVTCR